MGASPETIDLVGTWRLEAVTDWTDGVLSNPHSMGPEPGGYITYTPGGRMQVILDRRSVGQLSAKGRYGTDPIFAYAGTYTRSGGVVTHHLEMCTVIADIGTDYIRHIEVDGARLLLCTEPVERGGKVRVSKLEWIRDGAV